MGRRWRRAAVAGAAARDVGARQGGRDDGRAVAAGLPEEAGRAAAGGAQPGPQARRRSDGEADLLGDRVARRLRRGRERHASTGPRRTRRCTRSSTSWSGRSAPTSTAAACTRRWPTGRRRPSTSQPPVGHGLRRDLAGRRQDRLLAHARVAVHGADPRRARVRRRRGAAAEARGRADLTIGGAELAGQAIRAGLVDEFQLLLVPVLVGGGKPALPSGVRVPLELVEQRRFASGAVFLRHRLLNP